MGVYRVYVEKKPEFAVEARGLLADIQSFLGVTSAKALRIFNCYDVEGMEEELFASVKSSVFLSLSWILSIRSCQRREISSSPASICRDSSTSGRIRRPNVFS